MKYYLVIARNFILVVLTALGIAFAVGTAKQPPLNAPAIAEYQQSQYVRELLSPSVFTIKVKLFASEKDKEAQTEALCVQGIGTAFTVDKNGYFVTNNHVIDPLSRETACLEKLAKERSVPMAELIGVRFRIEYALTDTEKNAFPVEIVKTFPKIDLAVLKPSRTMETLQITLPEKWKTVGFRTGSPHIVGEKVISGQGLFVLPDEPVMTMGSPLNQHFTLANGKLGNNMFYEFNGVPFIHFIAPINSGDSGGPLISLLDFKIIGMTAMVKQDNGNVTQQAGAIPFWEIQKALKEVDMK